MATSADREVILDHLKSNQRIEVFEDWLFQRSRFTETFCECCSGDYQKHVLDNSDTRFHFDALGMFVTFDARGDLRSIE